VIIRFSTAASSTTTKEREKGRAKMIIVLKLKLQNCISSAYTLPGDCFPRERAGENNGKKSWI
jgi:hypothetical protein